MSDKELHWEWEIGSKTSWLGASFKELVSYKDLLFRLVRKEILMQHQQTLLGPIWVLLQPLLTVFTFVLVFNKVLQIPTAGIPPLLYYLSGITLWNLFSEILLGTANTFTKNAHVFGKVYFPRIIVPLSAMLLNYFQFFIQFIFLIIALAYYYFTRQVNVTFFNLFLCVPVIIIVSGIGLGAGLIFSVLTAKYRDLSAFLPIVVRLLMFLCPVFYSLSHVPQTVRWVVDLNPLSAQFKMFRFALVGIGDFNMLHLFYGAATMLLLMTGGLLLFNKKGDELIDVA
jgi:lipopolysaccharide transport system permease protein